MHRTSKFKLHVLAGVALLPSFLKRPCYRFFFGYRVGKRVRIGVSILEAGVCEIGDHVQIGHLNMIRGGDEVNLARYSELLRLNEINSIREPEVVNPVDPRFSLGAGSIVTTGHKIDFTDRVDIGRRAIIGGRNSSVWTHNRQRTLPIKIGEFAYVGSEIRMTPGSALPSRCVVGIGAVVTKKIDDEGFLIAGVPARPIKRLSAEDQFLIERKTRPDLPDDV